MKKKNIYIGVGIFLALAISLFFSLPSQIPEDVAQAEIAQETTTPSAAQAVFEDAEEVAINTDASSFEFEGFALGGTKSHVGTFEELDGVLFVEDGVVVGMQGVVQANSVKTDSGGLDAHLNRDDFFDTEVFPTIEYTTTEIADDVMTGDLTFRGITRSVTFPITRTEDSISADFLLDAEPFGMTHVGTSREVQITFNFVI